MNLLERVLQLSAGVFLLKAERAGEEGWGEMGLVGISRALKKLKASRGFWVRQGRLSKVLGELKAGMVE